MDIMIIYKNFITTQVGNLFLFLDSVYRRVIR